MKVCIILIVFTRLPFCFILLHLNTIYGRLLETVTDSQPIKLFSRERGRKVAWVEHLLQGLISSLQDGAGQEAEVGKT